MNPYSNGDLPRTSDSLPTPADIVPADLVSPTPMAGLPEPELLGSWLDSQKVQGADETATTYSDTYHVLQ